MINSYKKSRVPIVVTQLKPKKFDAYIPDFDVTVHGFDYVSVISNAIMVASSLYFFYLERNLTPPRSISLAEADKIAMSNRKSFATTITLLT